MSTTVVYSAAADDTVEAASPTYATALSTPSYANGASNATTTVGQNFDGATYYLDEMFLSFDTSGIPDSDTVSAAVLSLYGSADQSTTNFIIDAAAYNWGASVTTGDWRSAAQLAALTVIATYDVAGGWSTVAYNDFTEVTGGLAAAVNKTGTTYLVLYSARQASSTTPTNSEFVTAYTADDPGDTRAPKLTITHAATSTTDAPAGHAAATGIGRNAVAGANQPHAEHAAATGWASNFSNGELTVAAPHVAATGTAYNKFEATGHAAATGAAPNPRPSVATRAGTASAQMTGAAYNVSPVTGRSPAAEHAAATGAAGVAAPKVKPNASHASASGWASNYSTGALEAAAPKAAATGAATAVTRSQSASGFVNAVAPGIATTHDPIPTVGPSAGHAVGTGIGRAPSPSLKPAGGHASATGTAYAPSPTVKPSAGHAAGLGVAANKQGDNPHAEAISATGIARTAGRTIAPSAGHSAGAGAAGAPRPTVKVNAGHAGVTETTHSASVQVPGIAGHASATGAAQSATTTSANVAGLASATGTAYQPGASIKVRPAGVSTSAQAFNALALVAVNAGLASATGTAYQPLRQTIKTGARRATATGHAYNAGTNHPTTVGVPTTVIRGVRGASTRIMGAGSS